MEVFWRKLCAGCKDSCCDLTREEFLELDEVMKSLDFVHKTHLSSSRRFARVLMVGAFVRRTFLHQIPTMTISEIPPMHTGTRKFSFKEPMLFAQGRKMVRTGHGYLTLVPDETCAEDRVWIMKGGSAPLILRPSPHRGNRCFQLVGEASIHGMMKGELFELDKRGIVELI